MMNRLLCMLTTPVRCLVWMSAAGVVSLTQLGCASRAIQPVPASQTAAVPDEPAGTVWAGVYSAAEALRGQTTYRENCTYCHGMFLDGDDADGPALTGIRFLTQWDGRSVGDLVTQVSRTMPRGNAGALSNADYRALIAYVLQENGMPAGAAPLPADPALLAQVVITRRPATR